jgi:LysM domain
LTTKPIFVFRQIDPPGASLALRLDPTSIAQSGGVGGWDEIPHPKRPASTEWNGQPLRSLDIPVLFDGWRTKIDVEEPCRILEAWGRIPPGAREPAILQVVYGSYTPLRWVVNGLAWGDELRNHRGRRVRANVTVTLLEHRDAIVALTPVQRATPAPSRASSPGKPSSGAAVRPSGKTYIVRSGDNLSKIAQSQLGKASRWPEIARLNGLRDPDKVTAGQRLRLPA